MKKLFSLGLMLLTVSALVFSGIGHASADTFNANDIMDDSIFNNSGTLAVGNINAFLNQFPSSCISPNNGFSSPDPTGYSPSQGFTYGGNVSAGQVISDAAQAYGLNPEVLIATLQKESSVVTGTASYHCQYINTAMGYGCPDSGSCPTDPATMSGFSKQVIHAAWLFKFGQQRALGNVGWNVQLSNYPAAGDHWDNSDDPATCYGGPMTQGILSRGCGQAATYFDGYTTIDGSAVHMNSGATAALYWYTPHFSGNQNFFNIFTGWFGSTTLPSAFKTPSSSTVYVQTNGYKFTVPSMAMLQDYGISPGSIQTISQSSADSIPTPDTASTGLSTSLGYVVKSPSDSDADGGAVYLISVGTRYSFSSMQELSDYGFSTSSINYLPLNYITSLKNGGGLSYFFGTPSSNAFQVSSGTKRIIFDSSVYNSLNPSNVTSFLSDGTASIIPSGLPITNREILVSNTAGTVYLLDNNTYYVLPSMDTYSCWGFNGPLGTPLYRLVNDSYISSVGTPSGLGCLYNTDASTTYTLNGSNKILIPSSYGISSTIPNSDLLNLINKLPSRSSSLSKVVKGPSSATVWYIENGVKKSIPSMTAFNLLGLNLNQIDTISDSAVSAIPTGGMKLAVGEAVKTDDNGAVFVVDSDGSRISFASGDDFSAYGYNWNSIDSFPSTSLNSYYPSTGTSISPYLYDQTTDKVYLMGLSGCYSLDASQLTSFGQSQSAIQAGQSYSSSIFPYVSLSSCKPVSLFVKSSSQGTVYWVDSGQKHPFTSWQSLQSYSNQSNPNVITLSSTTINSLPTGTSL
ncbi:MAG TPA: hypothetical protein VHC21_00930 [Candidatus Saccharimonadales bacterium]|nr:hypothetical protein [Candidatus Saccharimonadales bacterium]